MPNELQALYFRHRSSFVLMLAAPIVLFAADTDPVGLLAIAIGLLLVGAGIALRLSAIRRIGRGARVHRAHASAGLIHSGPYGWTRNPLYLAAASMIAGFTVLAGGGGYAAPMFAVALAVYTPVILHEEEQLAGILGPPYLQYRTRVPRFAGPVWPVAGPDPNAPVPWSEVFRREKLLLPGSAAAALGILLWQAGWLPLGLPIEAIARVLRTGTGPALALAFFGGALVNSWKIERKHRRRNGNAVVQPAA